jgi:hypothetical protein
MTLVLTTQDRSANVRELQQGRPSQASSQLSHLKINHKGGLVYAQKTAKQQQVYSLVRSVYFYTVASGGRV